jgi:GntR family transcriptional repressor for pyruvate dehydrogenase complex
MENKEQKHKDQTLVEQTQERILEYISEQGYQYNSVIPKENELAEILGVSRVVIREANSGLRALGFLETKRKKGTIFVAPKIFNIMRIILMSGFVDSKSLQDMYELRLMLEIGMADLVVKNVTDNDIEQLKRIVDQEDTASSDEELRQLDIQFHTMLYTISGNVSLRYFQRMLSTLFKLYTPRSMNSDNSSDKSPHIDNWKASSMMTHNTLIEMLKLKDVELFRSAMRIHLENQFRNKERNLHSMETTLSRGLMHEKRDAEA